MFFGYVVNVVESTRHNFVESVVDVVFVPREGLDILYPLAVGYDYAARVGKYIGKYGDIALGKYLVGVYGRRSVGCFDYNFALDVAGYVRREGVERIVVGYPRQSDGSDSENAPRVKAFVQRLHKLLPDIPVEFFDERFTSVLAHQAMLEGGLRKKARQDKALVDEISATIILQSYMENRRFRGL